MFSEIKAIVRKDMLLDMRSKENFISMLFFSLVILIIFNFALGSDTKIVTTVAPGIFWVTFLLAGIIGLEKSFLVEKENGCIEFLLLNPVDKGNIFLGKMAGNIIFSLWVQACVIPLFILFFGYHFHSEFLVFVIVTLLTILGFSALGTLLAGITTGLKFSGVILPLLLFPLLIPLLLASVKVTEGIFLQKSLEAYLDWLKLLLAFDLIFLVVSYLTFEFVMEH